MCPDEIPNTPSVHAKFTPEQILEFVKKLPDDAQVTIDTYRHIRVLIERIVRDTETSWLRLLGAFAPTYRRHRNNIVFDFQRFNIYFEVFSKINFFINHYTDSETGKVSNLKEASDAIEKLATFCQDNNLQFKGTLTDMVRDAKYYADIHINKIVFECL